MQTLKKKSDISDFLANFNEFASRDVGGGKLYFVIILDDVNRTTIMQYPDGRWSTHDIVEGISDPEELSRSTKALVDFLWLKRKYLNRGIKSLEKSACV